MRLRQAHAMLEIAKAIEGLGLDFEFQPFDYDDPGVTPSITDDHMSGFAELERPDTPGRILRLYSAEITPGPHRFSVHVLIVRGYLCFDDNAVVLVDRIVDVAKRRNEHGNEDPSFLTGFAEDIAREVRFAIEEDKCEALALAGDAE